MDKLLYLKNFILIFNLQWFFIHPLSINDPCTPQGDLCLRLRSCPSLQKPVKEGFKPEICSFLGKEPVICCVNDIADNRQGESTKSISAKMCEKYRYDICPDGVPFVIGGSPARPKELTFMALLGYRVARGIDWRCGGAIISPRFVLSAAHCTIGRKPIVARLGDLDYSTDLEDAQPQQYGIEQIINHPEYKDKYAYNDITLLKLNKDAVFSDYVRPICLNQLQSVRFDKPVRAAGWGRDSDVGPLSEKLLKVDLQLFDPRGCNRKEFNKVPNGIDEKSMFCAGTNEGGNDTCQGDSGGPLFLIPSEQLEKRGCFLYTQIGITSFGYQCGVKGYPGVYINVNPFIPWIESIVWPSGVTDRSAVWGSVRYNLKPL